MKKKLELKILTTYNMLIHKITVETDILLAQAIKNVGIQLTASCEYNCACSTCIVLLQLDVIQQLNPPSYEEILVLEKSIVYKNFPDLARLSCQIFTQDVLDQSIIIIPIESLSNH